ncbi:Pumilio-like 1 [Hondaea fermentalgiana]|uniref:Pumilio-like 1 n=1 Tax=Hondaea fermentalgiana TaxID=2315210 RepID=A0A2R5FZP7_9STRA|nr:Pumilio-like 1 [Hondaea fermentalgiana]|eukprot:GBG24236.1 Pumilio-like 1 [Hondaea fermentalgiana]
MGAAQTTWDGIGLSDLLSELDTSGLHGRHKPEHHDALSPSEATSVAAPQVSHHHHHHHHARHTSLMGLKSTDVASWLDDAQDSRAYAADDMKVSVAEPSILFGSSRLDPVLAREPVEEPDANCEGVQNPEDRAPRLRTEKSSSSSSFSSSKSFTSSESSVSTSTSTTTGPSSSPTLPSPSASPFSASYSRQGRSHFEKRRSVTFAGDLESIALQAASMGFDDALDDAPFRGTVGHGGSRHRGHQRATSESAVFLSIAALGGNFSSLPSIPASPRPLSPGESKSPSPCGRKSTANDGSLLKEVRLSAAAQEPSRREHQSSGIESGPSAERSDQQHEQQRHPVDAEVDALREPQSSHPQHGHFYSYHPAQLQHDYSGHQHAGVDRIPEQMQHHQYAPQAGYAGVPMGMPGTIDPRSATAEQLQAIQAMQNQVMMQWMQMQEHQQRLIMLEQQRIAATAAAASGMYFPSGASVGAPHPHHFPAQMAPQVPMMPMMMGGALPPQAREPVHAQQQQQQQKQQQQYLLQQRQQQRQHSSGEHVAASGSLSPDAFQEGRARNTRGSNGQAASNPARGSRGTRGKGRNVQPHGSSRPSRNGQSAESAQSASRRTSQSPERSADGSKTMSTLLQHHKQAGYRPSAEELRGHVIEFARDSHGSRHIQCLNDNASHADRELLLEESLPEALGLMKDVFANYVIQNLLVHCDEQQRLRLLKTMKGKVLDLSLDQYGTRVVQRALEVAPPSWRTDLVLELCTDDNLVRRSARDPNATHVLQRAVDLLVRDGGEKPQPRAASGSRGGGRSSGQSGGSGSRRGTAPLRPRPKLTARDEALMAILERAIAAEAVDLSRNQNASRLVLLVLGDCDTARSPHISSIMTSLEGSYPSLVWDQHGVFAAGHVLASGSPEQVERVQNVVSAHLLELAKHKFGSHLVEKALLCASPEQVRKLLEPLVDDDGSHAASLGLEASPPESDGSVILHLAKDPYGNFVVSKAYEVSKGDLRDRLFTEVNARADILSRFTYGRHILNHVNK